MAQLPFKKEDLENRNYQLWQSDLRNYAIDHVLLLAPFLEGSFLDFGPFETNPSGNPAAIFFMLDGSIHIRGILEYLGPVFAPPFILVANIPVGIFDTKLHYTSGHRQACALSGAVSQLWVLSVDPSVTSPTQIQLQNVNSGAGNQTIELLTKINLNFYIPPAIFQP